MLSKKHEADKFKQLKFAMSAPMYNSLDKDQKKIFRTGFKNGYKLAKVHNIQDLNKAKSILHFIRRPQKKAVKKILSISQTDYIVGLVCDKYQVKHDLIYGKCRLEFICMVRSIIINLIYDLFEISTPELGRRFNRDHSTILHHTRLKFNKKRYLRESNDAIYEDYEKFKKEITQE